MTERRNSTISEFHEESALLSESDVKKDQEFNCLDRSKNALSIFCIFLVLATGFVALIKWIGLSDSRSEPANNGINWQQFIDTRGLTCHSPDEIEGGYHGGHCRGVFGEHENIVRNVTNTEDGIIAYTSSDNENTVDMIESHVSMMKMMIANGHKVHQHDPLFQKMFDKSWASKINTVYEKVGNSLKVIQTSSDPCTIKLIQMHAAAVTKFVENGVPEFLCEHNIPECVDV